MEPLKIYMGDLTHDTIILVSDTIPINIGFIAAYAKKLYGDLIDISLFKYPASLIEAIKQQSPDVLALSNYSWNSHLSERVAKFAKQIDPRVVTVQGGTNFPHSPSHYGDFLINRPATDLHVELEGEVSFANFIGKLISERNGGPMALAAPIDGCVFIDPKTRHSSEFEVVSGELPERMRDLDQIPSPYLEGILDHFFDGKLTPFIETNRGCPFSCTFCHTGNDYFRKTNTFSLDRIKAEIEYIGPRMSSLGIVNLHIADTNFGMYPRDLEICHALRESNDRYGWPLQIMATTGKNNKERVINITGVMGKMFSVNMSVQSMDENVLKNIKRDNIKLDHYIEINNSLNKQGRSTKGELILGMPGETRETFLKGLEEIINSGVSSVCIYTLMLLNGTEFQDKEYRLKHKIKGKFRIVPLDFGEYEGERVIDYEEVSVATNTMSFDDYLELRGIALLVESLHNGRPFEEFFKFALSLGISRTNFLDRVYQHRHEAPSDVNKIISAFLEETASELWDSEEDLINHYQTDENYQHLLDGDVGGNLVYKYKSMSLALAAESWILFLKQVLIKIASEQKTEKELITTRKQIDMLSEFCLRKLTGLLNKDGDTNDLTLDCPYDIVSWLKSTPDMSLNEFSIQPPIRYTFFYNEEQLMTRSDQFRRYGSDVNALSKIVTRVSNIESLIRKIKGSNVEEELFSDTDRDQFTRYTISR